jgi:5-methyltetrahydrofolate--homocysteine methyltransferase
VKHEFMELIKRKVVLFDGGMGSMLIAAGLREGEIPDSWSLSHPDKVKSVHAAYIEAGAEVIQTNTFGATWIKLASLASGGKLDVAAVNEAAAKLVTEARKDSGRSGIFVAGDIGPTGQFFPPIGTLTAEGALEAFREQAGALEQAGVDLFLIETMYDLREAVAALRAVREVSSRPVVVEQTFEKKPRGYFSLVGDTPGNGVEMLLAEGADVIGANCTLASGDMIELVAEFRSVTDAPLLFQPNAGKPELEHGVPIYRQTPEEFAQDVERIVRAGANAVGGCCGTTPDFIRAAYDRLTHGG